MTGVQKGARTDGAADDDFLSSNGGDGSSLESEQPPAPTGMGECRRSTPPPASFPDNDDLLLEILLRLPPLPSSLPRASLVCKRWRRLLSDPQFLRRFRAHHRKPPMLGFFSVDFDSFGWPTSVFTPTLVTPDRIPPARLSFPSHPGECLYFCECRHGLALLFNRRKLEAVVWDPITGFRLSIALPPEMKMDNRHPNIKCDMYTGAVVRNCFSGAFKVIMVLSNDLYGLAWACLYESESGKWGNIITTEVPYYMSLPQPSILVGNAICFLLNFRSGGVLQFDTDKQSLNVIQIPEDIPDYSIVYLLRTIDGGLGFAILLNNRIQLWGQTAISDRVVRWVLQKTIELDKLISLTPSMETRPTQIVGFDEDNNVIFLWTAIGVFMIQLESMKVTTLPKDNSACDCYPYTSFYTASNSASPHFKLQ